MVNVIKWVLATPRTIYLLLRIVQHMSLHIGSKISYSKYIYIYIWLFNKSFSNPLDQIITFPQKILLAFPGHYYIAKHWLGDETLLWSNFKSHYALPHTLRDTALINFLWKTQHSETEKRLYSCHITEDEGCWRVCSLDCLKVQGL